MEIISSYRREGRIEGREEGKIEGKKDSICTFLQARFGSSSHVVQEKVRTIDNLDLLDNVLKKIFAAESIEEAEDTVENAK